MTVQTRLDHDLLSWSPTDAFVFNVGHPGESGRQCFTNTQPDAADAEEQRYAYSRPTTIWVCRWGWPLGQALVSMEGRDHPLHLPTDGPVGQAGGQVHHGPH